MVDLANAIQIQIAADTARLRQGLTEAEGMIGSFQSRAERVGQSISSWGGSLTQAFKPLADFTSGSITTFAGFDAVLTDIQLYGGVATEQMGAVEAAALRMSQTTMFSAQQSAQAILEFAKTGYDAEDAMRLAEQAARLATVGDLDMATAAGVLTSSMAQFNLTASDTNMIIESLSRGAGASRADVATLAQGLANVGPVASAFNLSLDDTVAILSVFSDAGIQGADAGTQLRSMLMNLYQPTATTQAALRSLNLTLYDAEGNARPLESVFGDLIERMNSGEYSTQTLNESFQRLFGTYGIVGAQSLLAAGGWGEMAAAMDNATSAADIYAGKQETLQFQLGQLGTAWDGLKTTFGGAVSDTLTPVVEKITGGLRGLSDWVDENPELAGTLGTIALAGAAIGAVLMIAGPIVTAFAKGLGLLTALGGLLVSTGILSGITAALPALGTALGLIAPPLLIIMGVLRSDFDNIGFEALAQGFEDIGFGIAALVAGDPDKALASIADGLVKLASGAALIVAAPFDGVIKILNDLGLTPLTGLVDMAEMISGIFANIPIVITMAAEDVGTAVAIFQSKFQIAVGQAMAEIENNPLLREVMRFAAPGFVVALDEIKATTGITLGDWLVSDAEQQIGRIDLIAAIENELNKQMAAGEIDLGMFTYTDSFGTTITTSLRTQLELALTDPAFSEAIDSSLYLTIQNALTMAEDDDYRFLLSVVDALVLYGEVSPTIQQFIQNSLASGVAVDVPVFLNPFVAGVGGMPPTPAQLGAGFTPTLAQPRPAGVVGPMPAVGFTPPPAQPAQPDRPAGSGFPTFALGGMMHHEGLAYLHAGERVLNPRETRDYNRGGSQIVVNVTAYGANEYEFAALVERALRDRGI